MPPDQIAAKGDQRADHRNDDPQAVGLPDRFELILADRLVDLLKQGGIVRRAQGQSNLHHVFRLRAQLPAGRFLSEHAEKGKARSEEHTSELQSLMRTSY